MKTIEERALEWAHVLVSVNSRPATSELLTQIAEMSYSQGATEQQAIDIDKACEIYRKELSEIISTFNHLGKILYDIDELGELISLEGSINDFRKAMKGE